MSALNDRVRWRLRIRGEDGVASVIGTIFALLVFLTLLSLVITTYIPAWEKANEQEFMTETVYRFSTVKSVNGIMGEGDQQFVAMSLAPPRVPIFGKNILGNLTLNPSGISEAMITLTFADPDDLGGDPLEFSAGGSLEYGVFANTYLNQRVSYELGAVLISQPDGGLIKASPGISYTSTGSGPSTTYDLVVNLNDLVGNQASRLGTGTFGVSLTVTDIQDFFIETNPADTDMTMVITTSYPDAWVSWFDLRFVQTGVIGAGDMTVVDNEITLEFSNLDSITIKRTFTTISLE